jgi:hypothetical protein
MTAKQRTQRGKQDRLREQAIAALLASPSIAQAATTCNVAESTLRRWLRDPAFSAAFRQASSDMLDGAIGRLQGGLVEAAEALLRNLTCARPSVEVNAARALWDTAGVQRQLALLAAQLQQLERRMDRR